MSMTKPLPEPPCMANPRLKLCRLDLRLLHTQHIEHWPDCMKQRFMGTCSGHQADRLAVWQCCPVLGATWLIAHCQLAHKV